MDTQTPAGAGTGSPGPTPGTGPQPGATPPAPPSTSSFWSGIRRSGLHRSDDRWVAGVAGGLADRLGVDPLVVRGVLAVSFLLGGFGLVLYGVAWALLPDARDGRILFERLLAGETDGALLGSLVVVVVGLARGDGWWWFWDGGGALAGLLWAVLLVGLLVLVVTSMQRRGRARGPWQTPAPQGGPAPTGAAPAYGTPPGAPAATTAPTAGATTPAAAWSARTTTPLPPTGAYGAATPPVPPGPPAPPYGSAPAGGAPVPPPAPPRPPRQRRPGPDATTVATVVGLSVVALGALMLAERTGTFDGPVWLTAGGVFLVLAGLGRISLGFRGRRSGLLGVASVVAALVWVPGAIAHQSDDWRGDFPVVWRTDAPAASDVTVTNRKVAANGVSLGFGQSRVDLTGLPITRDTLHVPISIGAGDLTVVVPTDAAVRAEVSAGIGKVSWRLDDDYHERSGIALGEVVFEDAAAEAGTPDLVLEISSGVGEVRIIEEDAA
ncbi:MAG: PspC domain-containing protein [Cellulomonas iranensis]|uniref:PspC domain-containing protein n=1 Tax=Cellulomonas iranensis TaxID=76862 RepID=UPI001B29B99F|nr:PspC domain-containing protein [Cellulomonas iranensis]MBO9567797.1 PspC domain-containing protein [Cellulomonas iranensis]